MNKSLFLKGHLEGQPLEETCAETMAQAVERHSQMMQGTSQPRPLRGFERFMARRQRRRRF
jgi:hypothetical protein